MNRMNKNKPIEILLVEDNPGDVRLTIEAFKEKKITNHRLHTVMDGTEAMDFLHKTDKYKDAPYPNLVLLDLNLPKKDGREVLAEMKKDEKLRPIPVVILTTSDAEVDISRSYDLQANCYITKPVDLDQFIEVINSIQEFWLTIVKLPPEYAREQH